MAAAIKMKFLSLTASLVGLITRCDGSTAAIHLGIGHLTVWTVGDLVRQMAPPSQQANLHVIICQYAVMSNNIVVFGFLQVDYL